MAVLSGISKVLSENMKRLRELRDWRQEDLADAMAKILPSCSTGTIAGYEAGRRWPESEYIQAMAKALKVEESELFFDHSLAPSDFQAQALISFAKLLAGAHPDQVLQALQILEAAQPAESPGPGASRRRTAKPSTS